MLFLFRNIFFEINKHIFNDCKIHIHNPSARPFACRIDLSLFEIILMNLLTNAVKYNQSEVPRVDITFTPKGRELHIRFEDNGIGLPLSEIKKIFRKFYQIGRSDNMSARGSGLGLYLVDTIVRMHKGRIVAENSGSKKGSVFSVTLPFNPPTPTP